MQALLEFSKSLQAEDMDETLASYILDLVQTSEDTQDETMSHVSDILSSLSPGFEQLAEDTKLLKLWELWELVRTAQQCSDIPLVAEEGPAGNTSRAIGSHPGSESTIAGASTLDNTLCLQGSTPAQEEEPDPEVLQLQEFCPSACHDFLAYVLRTCGSLQSAVEWVLEAGDHLAGREAAWWGAQREAQGRTGLNQGGTSEDDKRLRQQVLARFDLQSLEGPRGGGGGTRKQQAPKPLSTWSSMDLANKTRYRDGQAVSFKGEKFVVQKTGEEWDGGSRGKVYTKGKRGKGFV